MESLLPAICAEQVNKLSRHVKINFEKTENLSKKITNEIFNGNLSQANWREHFLHPKIPNLEAIAWIFFIDTLNFSFWPNEKELKYKVQYKNECYTGYWSICAALNRALDNGFDLTNAETMANITIEQFEKHFKSCNNTEIPLLEERVKCLQESGKVLLEKFDGHFSNCIKQAEESSIKLLELIIVNFSSFRDEAIYNNLKVGIYKRAQILIADIWCCFEGKSFGKFHDIHRLTAFADYRVPQVLAHFGCLEYSENLLKILNEKKVIQNGDELEVEIRCGTIHCIELIVKAIHEQNNDQTIEVNSIIVDNFLWDYRRDYANDVEATPMHRTRCIYY